MGRKRRDDLGVDYSAPRTCVLCGVKKTLGDFWLNNVSGGKVYFKYECKECLNERKKKRKQNAMAASAPPQQLAFPFITPEKRNETED